MTNVTYWYSIVSFLQKEHQSCKLYNMLLYVMAKILLSEWLLFNAKWTFFLALSIMTKTSYISSSSSLKQQSTDRHVAIRGHVSLNLSQSVFAIILKWWESTNTNFIVFGLTRPGLEQTIYHTLIITQRIRSGWDVHLRLNTIWPDCDI